MDDLPKPTTRLELDLIFTPEEFRKLRLGFDRRDDQDYKWHIFMSDDWLYINRNLGDRPGYKIRFILDGDLYKAIEAWTVHSQPVGVSTEEFYRYHQDLLKNILRWYIFDPEQ